jgi:hypothetical protein
MDMTESRPLDFPIGDVGKLSQAVRSRGYRQFAEVAEAVKRLPYGRLNSEDDLAVLDEERGTCSSKHRFLAALAHECGHAEVKLMLGLYSMSEKNTPGVGTVLRAEGLAAILEAHCYLMCGEHRFDFTGLPFGAASPFESLIDERAVSPSDLPSAKATYHRNAIVDWARTHGIDPDHAWAIREKCIELLANRTLHLASESGARAAGRERYTP